MRSEALPTPSLHPSAWRRRWFTGTGRQAQLSRPVISIGNIAMGGRGKTPVVAHVARMLVEWGHRPAILSRGYGRRIRESGVVVVSDGRHLLADLDRSGDEPLMLARETPGAAVLVCADRRMAGELAERNLGATVHVLDDGFQHVKLRRDVDIVIVSAGDLQGRPLPAGRLREPVAAIAAADALVIDGPGGPEDGVTAGEGQEVFRLRREVGEVTPLEPERPWSAGRRVAVVVAGIVRPERLAESAAAAGWTVAETMGFADHHQYTRRDLARIADRWQATGADAVLTTAKDAARLMPLRPLPVPFGVVPLRVSVEPAPVFAAWLQERVGARP